MKYIIQDGNMYLSKDDLIKTLTQKIEDDGKENVVKLSTLIVWLANLVPKAPSIRRRRIHH